MFRKTTKTYYGGTMKIMSFLSKAVFSQRPLSCLTFPKVFCLQTSLSNLKMIGVFKS